MADNPSAYQPSQKVVTGPLEFSLDDFARFAALLERSYGMYFDESKYSAVKLGISERCRALLIKDANLYYKRLTATGPEASQEMRQLADLLSVNETLFFRNKEHFAAITEEILPRLIRRNAVKRTLKIWSAGCSTGQEPYSLAMAATMVLENMGYKLYSPAQPDGWQVEILATDISERALRHAIAGRYRRSDLRGLDDANFKRFFSPLATGELPYEPGMPSPLRGTDRVMCEVRPLIRTLVKFGYFNLAQTAFPHDRFHDFDLILCENVIIYFTPQVTRQVIDNLYKALAGGGFLFIGFSETLWQISDKFRLINTHDSFYYQKPFPGDPVPVHYTRTNALTGPLNIAQTKRLTGRLAPKPTSPTNPLPQISQDATDTSNKTITRPIPVPPTGAATNQPMPPARPQITTPNPLPIVRPQPMLPSLPLNNTQPAPASAPQASDASLSPQPSALQEGLDLMARHEFGSAEKYLEQALTAAPQSVEVLVAMAQLKTKLGQYRQAASYSRSAIAIDQLCEEAHLILAMIYQREGQLDQSIHEFHRTIYINMDSVVAHLQLADIYRSRNQLSEALREYKSALNALNKRRPDEVIEDLPVALLKQACQENIRRLSANRRV